MARGWRRWKKLEPTPFLGSGEKARMRRGLKKEKIERMHESPVSNSKGEGLAFCMATTEAYVYVLHLIS
jgi:hypothetical protein